VNQTNQKNGRADPMASPAGGPAVIFVGGGKGGVGKTHRALMTSSCLVKAGMTPFLIEVEAAPRISLIHPDRCLHVPFAKLGARELRRNPSRLAAVFDPALVAIEEKLEAGVFVIVDLAANADFALADYLLQLEGLSVLGAGQSTAFMSVTTGDSAALEDALTGLAVIGAALPASRRLAVVNDVVASAPCKPASDKFVAFDEHARRGGALPTAYVTALEAERLLTFAKARQVPFEKLRAPNHSALAATLGVPSPEAARDYLAFARHSQEWEGVLQQLGVLAPLEDEAS